MKNIAVILARGGSKGIPNKNIINLCGKPLISYVISAAILSDVQETWVSTDSNDIAEIAKANGANVLILPKELTTDTASSEGSLIFSCENIEADNVVFIQPTSPLLTHHYINAGLNKMKLYKYDSVFSVYKEHWLPRWEVDKKEGFINEINWHRFKRPRRQDIDDVLVENGAFYINSRKSILDDKLRYKFSSNIGYIVMNYSDSFQVDTEDDLFIIESLLKNRK